MPSNEYDLAIIGGGITGAGIARDAALRGLKVILCEKGDFGEGASSKSSKLIHGGLRYLEQFDFGLVKESLEERSTLLRTDPLHVKWLSFLLPIYKTHRRPFWMIRLGLRIYDLFSQKAAPPFTTETPAQILQRFPQLNPQGLKGGCLYFDAQMDDSRIVIENLRAAKALGAEVLNYTPATLEFDSKGKVVGIAYAGKQALAKTVIDATGAWSPTLQQELALKPTKGVHLVIPEVHPDLALTLEAPQDGRIFFLIPWRGATLLGTTETPYSGPLDHVAVEPADRAYLLEAFRHYFPNGRQDILGAFAGVRPLVQDAHRNPFKISRKPLMHRSANSLLTVVGGKYTIYRKMAQEAVDLLTKAPCTTLTTPLSETAEELRPFAVGLGLEKETCDHLLGRYGKSALKILKRIEGNSAEKEKFCPFHPHIRAEIPYAMEEEFVLHPEDWFLRRTSIGYNTPPGCLCLQTLQTFFNQRKSYDSVTIRPHHGASR